MKSSSHAKAARKAANAASAMMPAAFADTQRQQMAVAGESAGALFRGFEAIGKIQAAAAQDAIARHSAAAANAGKPTDAAQFLFAQTQLLREDLEASMKCWEEVALAAMEMQSELAACCTHLVASESALPAAAVLAH